MVQALNPKIRAEQLHRPQRRRRLVDGDEVARVERAEEQRLPAARAGLDGGGVERRWRSRRRRQPHRYSNAVATSRPASGGPDPAGIVDPAAAEPAEPEPVSGERMGADTTGPRAGHGGRHRQLSTGGCGLRRARCGRNTQSRSRTKRRTVAARLAATSTLTSSQRAGSARGRRRSGERAAGQAEAEPEDDQALQLVAPGGGAAADAEGEAAVGRGVGDRGDQQCHRVRRLGAQPAAQRRNSAR